jgi:molybdopterin-guanine dinucleotide biosynthesis protein A
VIAAAIVAGGAARRMGGVVKPLLEVDGRPILDRQVDALRAAGASAIALAVSDPPPAPLLAAAGRLGLVLVHDAAPGQGPLAGLEAALAWSPAPGLICLAGDGPWPAVALLATLRDRIGAVDAVVPRPGGAIEPLVAAYRTSCRAIVEARLRAGLLRARELPAALVAAGLAVAWIDDAELGALDPGFRSFTNWNRPEDRG